MLDLDVGSNDVHSIGNSVSEASEMASRSAAGESKKSLEPANLKPAAVAEGNNGSGKVNMSEN